MVRTPPFHDGNTGSNPVGNARLPIYQVVEKVLDFADVVVINSCLLQQKCDFGNVSLVQLDRTIAF